MNLFWAMSFTFGAALFWAAALLVGPSNSSFAGLIISSVLAGSYWARWRHRDERVVQESDENDDS